MKMIGLALAAASISLISCVRDLDAPSAGGGEKALVKLSISTPKPAAPKATRAVDNENSIEDVWILVFGLNGGAYSFEYAEQAQNLQSGEGYATFSALLKMSDENLKLMILANASAAISDNLPATGMSEDQIRASITARFGSGGLTTALPMWGEALLPGGIDSNGASISATMLRSVARADIVKNLDADSGSFELESAYLFRTNDRIQVAPGAGAMAAAGLAVESPSVPQASVFNGDPVVYTVVADEGAGVESIRKMYLPEAMSDTGNTLTGVTSLVIGGYFNGETTPSYYRVDFNPGVAGHPFGQILRNHRYTFNIIKVWGRGWATPEDAAQNQSTNVNVVIENWNDFTTDMVFDWEHYFGVSSRRVTLNPQTGSSGRIEVETDVVGYTIEWADANGNGLGNAAGLGGTIENDYFRAETSADGKNMIFTALQSNEGGPSPRTGYVLVRANRFTILVTIVQNVTGSSMRPIKLLSTRSLYGFLGTSLGGIADAEARAQGLRGLLTNTSNFGPAGVVETDGYTLFEVSESLVNNINDLYLSTFDIVYISLISSTSVVNAATAAKIGNWLSASENRFLIMINDLEDRNKNILDVLGITGRRWWAIGSTPYQINSSPEAAYFTSGGPFTQAQGVSIPSSFTFRKYDIYHSEIGIAENPGFIPILTGVGGGMVLGLNPDMRVLFVGDVDLFNSGTGQGGDSNNHLTNTTGVINNNASLLLANVWAYIAETVLGE